MSGFIAILVLIALAVLGGWATRTQSLRNRLLLLVGVPTVLFGITLLSMIHPMYAWGERLGTGIMLGILAFSELSVVLNRWVWHRPWLLLVLLPIALFFGFVLAVNIGEQFGMPH